jgi:hypothetical protein
LTIARDGKSHGRAGRSNLRFFILKGRRFDWAWDLWVCGGSAAALRIDKKQKLCPLCVISRQPVHPTRIGNTESCCAFRMNAGCSGVSRKGGGRATALPKTQFALLRAKRRRYEIVVTVLFEFWIRARIGGELL